MIPITHVINALSDAVFNHPTTQLLIQSWDGDRIVEVDGVMFHMVGDWKTLEPGDVYVAGRNGPPKIFCVREVKSCAGYVCSTGPMDYPFDLHECYKVELAE